MAAQVARISGEAWISFKYSGTLSGATVTSKGCSCIQQLTAPRGARSSNALSSLPCGFIACTVAPSAATQPWAARYSAPMPVSYFGNWLPVPSASATSPFTPGLPGLPGLPGRVSNQLSCANAAGANAAVAANSRAAIGIRACFMPLHTQAARLWMPQRARRKSSAPVLLQCQGRTTQRSQRVGDEQGGHSLQIALEAALGFETFAEA